MEAIQKIEENVPVIQTLLQHFEAGSPELLGCVTEDIDLRIEHYRDDTDVSWQRAESIQGLVALLGRLTAEIFPQGTKILGLDCRHLGDGWYQTEFVQTFWYPLEEQKVVGRSLFISHEAQGKVDFLREIVTSVEPA